MATRKTGKPYIHVTWLAKLLGGHECVWSAWFRAHHQYQKFETQGANLAQWNREHDALMRARRLELERQGYTVTVEEANAFKLEGSLAIIAGKPDLVACRPATTHAETGELLTPAHTLIVDGKTGRERESDIWQVLLYLYAYPKVRTLTGELEGEVQYKSGDVRIATTPAELTPERWAQVLALIQAISRDTPPPRTPSRYECRVCNIGPQDCPQRINTEATVGVSEF